MLSESPAARHFERVLHLRKLPLLRDLPASELAVLADHATNKLFPAGAVLMRPGEPVGALQFVIEGRLSLARAGRPVGRAGPGAGVGGLGVLAGDDEGLEARAEIDTLTLELSADAVNEALEDRFSIFRHVLREVCRQCMDELRRTGLTSVQPRQVPLRVPSRSLDLVERLFLLRRLPPFARSSLNSLADLSRSLNEVRFERGAKLWRAGESATSVLLLVDGVAECTGPEGLHFQVAGQPLGHFEALAGAPRWFEALAQTPLLALKGRSEELLDVFEDNFRMGMDFLAAMARGLLRQLEHACERAQGEDGHTGVPHQLLARYYGFEPLAEVSRQAPGVASTGRPAGVAPNETGAGPAAPADPDAPTAAWQVVRPRTKSETGGAS